MRAVDDDDPDDDVLELVGAGADNQETPAK
jgi:hypothetical protein